MPTVMRIGPYRFFFYSNEGNEPPHIHVETGGKLAKFWLDPTSLADNIGYNAREIHKIEALVRQYQQDLLQAWRDYFGH